MLIDIFIHLNSESFRCGVFFAGKKYRDKPFQKLFILPKRFSINTSYVNVDENNDVDHSEDRPKRYSSDASCPINNPYGTADVPSVHNDTCFHIVSPHCHVKIIIFNNLPIIIIHFCRFLFDDCIFYYL